MRFEDLRNIILDKTNQIFKDTLEQKDYTLELTSLNTYFYWLEFLGENFSSKCEVIKLINEATFDLVSSLFNSLSGFYRQGMIALRSSLELTGLYVYYFDHPIEFKYFFSEGGWKGPLLSQLIDKGEFLVKKYYSLFVDEEKLRGELHTEVRNTYKKLSLYVHGRLGKLQTFDAFPIVFSESEFVEFMKEWEKVIDLGNTILAVRFYKEINEINTKEREKICSVVKKLGILEV